MPNVSDGIAVDWSDTPVSKTLIARAVQSNQQEVQRLKGKLPLVKADEASLFDVMASLGQTGILVFVEDVTVIKTGRMAVQVGLSPITTTGYTDKSVQNHAAIIFRAKRWSRISSSSGFHSFASPTSIPLLVGMPEPSKQFEKLFRINHADSQFSAARYLLGAYEKRVYGNAFRQKGLELPLHVPPGQMLDDLLARSEPKQKKSLDTPDSLELGKFLLAKLQEYHRDLVRFNDESAEGPISGIDGMAVPKELADLEARRAAAIREFSDDLTNQVKSGKLTLRQTMLHARIVAIDVLGSKSDFFRVAKDGFGIVMEGTLKRFEANMRQAAKEFEDTLEGEGLINPKEGRKRGRRKRQRIWNNRVTSQVPDLIAKATATALETEKQIFARLAKFGKYADRLGKLSAAISLSKLFIVDTWEERIKIVFEEVLQEIASIIFSVVGRYTGIVVGGALGTLLGGPAGTLIGASVGYFAGAFLGGYIGSVIGEKLAERWSPLLMESLNKAYETIEDEVEKWAEQYDDAGAFFTERDIKIDAQGRLVEDSILTAFERMLKYVSGALPSDPK